MSEPTTPSGQEPQAYAADVVIVGGGPTGLTLALDLGRRGVRTLLIEQGTEPLPGARAGVLSERSMEHMRRLGVADAIRAASPVPPTWPRTNVYATRLFGRKLTTVDTGAGDSGARPAQLTSEKVQNVPSAIVEKVLRAELTRHPTVQTRYGHRAESFTTDEDGVSVLARALDGEQILGRGRWLVAADGANSALRSFAGIGIEGRKEYEDRVTLQIWTDEFEKRQQLGEHNIFWVVNRDMIANFVRPAPHGRWNMAVRELNPELESVWPDPHRLLRLALGEDCPVDELRASYWKANAFMADTFSIGNVFLAGDAAHASPPGNYGAHSGIGDATDLAWKFAAILQGWGSPALLGTYERERRPINQFFVDNVDTTAAHFLSEVPAEIEEDSPAGEAARTRMGEFLTSNQQVTRLGGTLGYCYDDSPIIVHEESAAEPLEAREYTPSSRPGARLPHVWLGEGDSIYDHIGAGFALLFAAESKDIADDVALAAQRLSIPFRTVELDAELLAQTYEARLLLVRTDHHVVWRSDSAPASAEQILRMATGFELG